MLRSRTREGKGERASGGSDKGERTGGGDNAADDGDGDGDGAADELDGANSSLPEDSGEGAGTTRLTVVTDDVPQYAAPCNRRLHTPAVADGLVVSWQGVQPLLVVPLAAADLAHRRQERRAGKSAGVRPAGMLRHAQRHLYAPQPVEVPGPS